MHTNCGAETVYRHESFFINRVAFQLFHLTAHLESAEETVLELALRCGLEWEKSRLSHQLRRMEERGLVTREECIEDNRGSVVRITTRGQEVAEEAKRHYAALIRHYVSDVLTEDQMTALGAIADALLTNLGDPKHVR